MNLFKKWAKHKVNQFLREKHHKKWNQECKQKQYLLFNFCNIFDLLTSRTQKIAWWCPVFRPDFYIFSYNQQLRKMLRNFIDKFLFYHTSLRNSFKNIMCSQQKWASPPRWDLNYFAGILHRWDENFSYEHAQVGQHGKVG